MKDTRNTTQNKFPLIARLSPFSLAQNQLGYFKGGIIKKHTVTMHPSLHNSEDL